MWKLDKIILIIIVVTLFWLFVTYFGNVFVWLMLSVFICVIGIPIVSFIEKIHIKNFKIPKYLSVFITLCFITGIIFLCFRFFVPLIINEITKFQSIDIMTISERLEKPIKELEDFISSTGLMSNERFYLADFVVEKIHSLLSFKLLGNFLNNISNTIAQLFLGIFSILFISFFFLKDKDKIIKSILSIIPEKIQTTVKATLKNIKTLIVRYFYGILAEIVFLIVFCTIGFLIVGVNFSLAVLIGILIGVLNIIPYIGPIIASFFGLILVTLGNINMDSLSDIGIFQIKFLSVVVIAEIIDSFLLSTFIRSKSIKAHPVEVYLVIIIAGSLYGIIGMIFAIPVYTIIRVIAKTYIEYEKLPN